VATSRIEAAAHAISDAVAGYHRAHPGNRGAPLAAIRKVGPFDPHVVEGALARLRMAGTLEVFEGLVRQAGFRPQVSGGDAAVGELVDRITSAGLTPPSVSELAAETRRPDVPAMLRLAAADGRLVAVERDRYFSRTALNAFVGIVVDETRDGPLSIPRLRDRLGISRKYLIPLLEWSDREGHTVRIGDIRRGRTGDGAAARSN
jgi:selenocysteine-specific elongation factor